MRGVLHLRVQGDSDLIAMMQSAASLAEKFLVSLTYPPTLSFWVGLCGLLLMILRWRKTAVALCSFALSWSLLWSVPVASDWLRGTLENRYPVMDEAALPRVDAVVVLGGGNDYAWLERAQVHPDQLEGSRLAAGARAWLAGRAQVVVLSGGGGGGNGDSEAYRMAEAIARLGVPASALMLEEHSRDTRDNARNTTAMLRGRGMQRVLLVTSSLHMPRASLLFREAGVEVLPVPVLEPANRATWRQRWFPSRRALWRSGRAWKEYAGLMAVYLTISD
jgi:uncharacterized SAM-binding protein YcdF (DUF218 family)